MDLWHPAYIGVGSNVDDPAAQVRLAVSKLTAMAALRLVSVSPLYRSRAFGPVAQADFVNAAAGLLTQLDARQLLAALLGIEQAMGRIRAVRWGPRLIDLDLVWMVGPPIQEPDFTLPHPGVSMRNFVLYPLDDIAPALDIPGHGRVRELKLRSGSQGIALAE